MNDVLRGVGGEFMVPWIEMQYGTREHYEYLGPAFYEHARRRPSVSLVDNLMMLLGLLKGSNARLSDRPLFALVAVRNPGPGALVRPRGLDVAGGRRASWPNVGQDEPVDMVVAALLHDVADGFAPENHSDAAAGVTPARSATRRPYVDEETHWVIKHHGLFQGYYYFHHHDGDRNAHRCRQRCTMSVRSDSPYYDRCVDFCHEYDQNCFDPNYPVMDLHDFRPMLDEVFSRPSSVPGVAPLPG